MNKKANIKIIESFRLGGNKFISIVKIGEAYYALGFGKDEITMIDKLDEDSIILPEDKNQSEKKSFKEILISINDKEIQEKIDKK